MIPPSGILEGVYDDSRAGMDPTGMNTRLRSGTVNYTSRSARLLTGTAGHRAILNANSSEWILLV